MLAALIGLNPAQKCLSDECEAARDARFYVQIANPDAHTAIRVSLDDQIIFEGAPLAPSSGNSLPHAVVQGPFMFPSGTRHVLVAEAVAATTKAQLQWIARTDGSAWVVVHYYSGRGGPLTPPFFTFSLQANSYKLH